ncbi:MAG: beta-ketoacyl-ACP synthase [Pseudomonadota bacterium]|nr:beta-ketoacyl-ACP synthase [Pseudomonadota bacterium]
MPLDVTPTQTFCRLHAPALVCPLGDDLETIASRLFSGTRGLVLSDEHSPGRPLWLGAVTSPLPDDNDWPARHRSRNNRLLDAAFERLIPLLDAYLETHPQARLGIVLGTSTSGIGETERAVAQRAETGHWPEDFHYARHEIGAPSDFLAWRIANARPNVTVVTAYTLSTACTSSAKALTSARRMLKAGLCDVVIAGGADSLCGLTVNGFSALEAVSNQPCQPFAAQRDGINLGEGAALFLVSGEPGGIQLSGYGETSDAHHISAPRPDGEGALNAMQAALEMAGLTAADIDYLNLHGTATRQNDAMESRAVSQAFPAGVACGSTKSLTGHTLGACGALEAAFCWLAMQHDRCPPHLDAADPTLPQLALCQALPSAHTRVRRTLSNAFAFGGNNISLVMERTS